MMKAFKKKIVMLLEKTDTGFSAYAKEFPIYTTGQTISELLNNSFEATNLYFEGKEITITPDNIQFEIDLKQFFQYYRVLNSKFLAERIGMNPTLLSQYVQGRKKPSKSQTEKILLGINKIGQELSEIRFIRQ